MTIGTEDHRPIPILDVDPERDPEDQDDDDPDDDDPDDDDEDEGEDEDVMGDGLTARPVLGGPGRAG